MSCILEMRGITKQFSGNNVLKHVDFDVYRGEVHALVGENGAGKSTLMKVLAGMHVLDDGQILLSGQRVCIGNPKQALDLGISMVQQEMNLFPDLTVAENIFMRREPIKSIGWPRFIDWERVYKETLFYINRLELGISPKALVKNLGIGQQKLIEIIRAVSQRSRIIIMDEPTAALADREVLTLFDLIREVKELGIAVIYISHRLEEITKIADRVTILRDGQVVQTCRIDETDMNQIIEKMAGKGVEDRYPKLKVKIGREALRVENLGYDSRIKNISFNLSRGEILGITGLSGSGRRTLANTLFGVNFPYEGEIFINNRMVKIDSPEAAIKNGLCYVTCVGVREGLVFQMAVSNNITITNLKRISERGLLDRRMESMVTNDFIKRLEIRASGVEHAGNLSGGNQKKVTLAKWLFANSRVLIFGEPTSGIDISTKVDVYNIINELARSGASIIMISSDIPELLGMCDKIMVMYNGEIRVKMARTEATQERILYYASGGMNL